MSCLLLLMRKFFDFCLSQDARLGSSNRPPQNRQTNRLLPLRMKLTEEPGRSLGIFRWQTSAAEAG